MMVKYVVENRCYCFYSSWWSSAKASFSAILQGTSFFKPGTSSSLSAHNLSKTLLQHSPKNHPTPPTLPISPSFPPRSTSPSHLPPTLLTKPRPDRLLRHPHATPMKPLIRTLLIIARHHIPVAHALTSAVLPLIIPFRVLRPSLPLIRPTVLHVLVRA